MKNIEKMKLSSIVLWPFALIEMLFGNSDKVLKENKRLQMMRNGRCFIKDLEKDLLKCQNITKSVNNF